VEPVLSKLDPSLVEFVHTGKLEPRSVRSRLGIPRVLHREVQLDHGSLSYERARQASYVCVSVRTYVNVGGNGTSIGSEKRKKGSSTVPNERTSW